MRIKGKGGYFADAASKVVSKIENSVTGFFDKLFGFGEYGVIPANFMGDEQVRIGSKQADLHARVAAGQQPPVVGNLSEGTIIRHTEFIGEVVEPASNDGKFTNTTYALQPGNSSVFPWGSTQALGWTHWKPRKMMLYFESNSSAVNNAAGSGIGLGTVALSSQYNVTDVEFGNLKEALNSNYATSAKPSNSFYHAIECDERYLPYNQYFVDPNINGDDIDDKTSTLAIVNVMTEGIPTCATPQVLGKLFITYEIELSKQKLVPGSKFYWFVCASGNADDTHWNDGEFILMPGSDTEFEFTASGGITLLWPLNLKGTFMVVLVPEQFVDSQSVTPKDGAGFSTQLVGGLLPFEKMFPKITGGVSSDLAFPDHTITDADGDAGVMAITSYTAGTGSIAWLGGSPIVFPVFNPQENTDPTSGISVSFTAISGVVNRASLFIFALNSSVKPVVPTISLQESMEDMKRDMRRLVERTQSLPCPQVSASAASDVKSDGFVAVTEPDTPEEKKKAPKALSSGLTVKLSAR